MTAMPPDQFSLPCEIADDGSPLGQPRPGTPSESWQARGLASPAGRGWQPVAPAGAHSAAVAGHDAPIDPPGVFERERQRAFLLELAECGQVRAASARCGISYRTVYRERRANPAFARAWEAALLSARAFAEDVLAAPAIDGVEEAVFFRGEEVGRRVHFDSRLLLAHLARLDRRAEDAATCAYAGDLDGALDRYVAGCDDPAPLCPDCGEALPMVQSDGEGQQDGKRDEGDRGPAPAVFSPGPCDRCDMPSAKAAAAREAEVGPCPDCGGFCLDPNAALTRMDCQWFGNRLDRMEAARPAGARPAHDFAGYGLGEVDDWQLWAFEDGVPDWWLVVPPPQDAPEDEEGVWYYDDDRTPWRASAVAD